MISNGHLLLPSIQFKEYTSASFLLGGWLRWILLPLEAMLHRSCWWFQIWWDGHEGYKEGRGNCMSCCDVWVRLWWVGERVMTGTFSEEWPADLLPMWPATGRPRCHLLNSQPKSGWFGWLSSCPSGWQPNQDDFGKVNQKQLCPVIFLCEINIE